MFKVEIQPVPNSVQQRIQMSFQVWGTETEFKVIEYTVNQRKTAYELFVTHAAEYLRWTSDHLYNLLQGIRKHYFDLTGNPYFGYAQKNWATVYWSFLESRDRVRQFPFSEKELAKSYRGKLFGELIPIYQFPEREEIKQAVADIEKLSSEILATIRKLQNEVGLPISA